MKIGYLEEKGKMTKETILILNKEEVDFILTALIAYRDAYPKKKKFAAFTNDFEDNTYIL